MDKELRALANVLKLGEKWSITISADGEVTTIIEGNKSSLDAGLADVEGYAVDKEEMTKEIIAAAFKNMNLSDNKN